MKVWLARATAVWGSRATVGGGPGLHHDCRRQWHKAGEGRQWWFRANVKNCNTMALWGTRERGTNLSGQTL
jgi:hypothetical protein